MPGAGRPGGAVPAAPTERLAERLGPYRLIQRIGQGGMGVVHLALDPSGRAVAIKVLRPHIAEDPEARDRLQRELDTLARVDHPRVAPVFDADISGPLPYLVTRYIGGDPLDDVVTAYGPLSGPALLTLAQGLADALDAIHAAGIVHRDLKPGNVMLDDDGLPVLIDFGIAHVADDVRLTSSGLVMGTPGYLAPEIIEGAEVTGATDWWGWAATLAYAATGRPPFGSGGMDVVLARVRSGQFDLGGVDPRLAPLLAAALSPDPAQRPPVDAVLAGLRRYADGDVATTVLPIYPDPSSPPASPVNSPPYVGYSPPYGVDPAPVDPGVQRHTRALPQQQVWGPGGAVPQAWQGQDVEPHSQEWDGEVSTWDEEWSVEPGQTDPRIGRPDRSGTLLAGVALTGALAANAPMAALLLALVWAWVARFADKAMTSLLLRRHEFGHRRRDVPLSIALSPVHVVTAALAAVLGAVLPVLVGVAMVFCVALALAAATGGAPTPVHPLGLGVGAVASLLMAWWGPGGASLRRGSRSMVRGVVRAGLMTDVVVGMLVAASLALAVWAFVRGGAVLWWPLSSAPGFLGPLPTGR